MPTDNRFKPLRLPANYTAAFKLYGFEPFPYQLAVYDALAGKTHYSLADDGTRLAPRTIVLATGVRAGKSYGLAGIVPAFVLTAMQDCTIAIGGLEHRHARAIFDQVAAHLDDIDATLGGRPGTPGESVLYRTRRVPDGLIRVKAPSGAIVTLLRFSCDNPNAVRGQTLALAIVDEISFAQDGGEDILAQLKQRTMTTQGQIVLASSPNGLNHFGRLVIDAEHTERQIAAGRPRDVFDPVIIRASTWDSPLVDLAQLKSERQRLPRWKFDQDYGGHVVVADKSLFRNFPECIVRELPTPHRDTFYVAGLDPAGAGEDYSALVVLDGQTRQIVYANRWQRISNPEMANKVAAITQRYGAALVMDATAGGSELARQIRAAGAPSVEEVKFTADRKAELVMRLQGQIDKGAAGLQIPHLDRIEDDDFRATIQALLRELELYQAIQRPNGTFKFEVPSGSGHDDLVTALYLAMKRAQLSNAPNSRVTRGARKQRSGTSDMDCDPRSRVFSPRGYSVGSSIWDGRGYF